jgi:Zn-finger nucleic acid-binding protein
MSQNMGGQGAGLICPACRVDLVMSERQGVEIDYCPRCRGVWLDRGELDKILERSAAELPPQAPPPAPFQERGYAPEYRRDRDHDDYKHHKHKRRSFLHDLFDD